MNQKAEQFRESIRRQHIQQQFMKRRKQYSSTFFKHIDHTSQLKKISTLLSETQYNGGKPPLKVLSHLSFMSQTESNIKLIGESAFIEILPSFISEEYLNSDQQFHASLCLCNVFYERNFSLKFIKKEFLMKLLDVIKCSTKEKTKQNCLRMIQNIVIDADINSVLMLIDHPQLDLISVFYGIFSQQEPSMSIVCQMLASYYVILKKLKKQKMDKLKKLKKYVLYLLKVTTNPKEISLILLCLYQLFWNVPEEGNLSKTGFILILGNFALELKDEKQTIKIIKIINYSTEKIQHQEIANVLLPITSKILSTNQNEVIHTYIYKILYDIFMKDKQNHQLFVNKFYGMFEIMLNDFQCSESVSLLTELAYVFCLLLYNYKSALETDNGHRIMNKLQILQEDTRLTKETLKFIRNMYGMILER